MYSNCVFALLYLLLRGKVKKIIGISSIGKTRSIISHVITINKYGHALHFKHIMGHEYNTFAPWWFWGKISGISAKNQKEALNKSGRKIIWTSDKVYIIGFLFFLLFFILAIPWLFCWLMYSIYFCTMGTYDALKKRFKRKSQ